MPRKRRLHTNWFDVAMSVEDKEQREKIILASGAALEILASIVRKKKMYLDQKTKYEGPEWQFNVAKDLGRKEEINDLLLLLDPVIGEISNDPN